MWAAAALVPILFLSTAVLSHGYASIEPPFPLTDVAKEDPRRFAHQASYLASIGSSQEGVKYLVSNNIDSFAAGVPEELASQEPGLSQLAAAVEAYSLLYPGVDFVTRFSPGAWPGGLTFPINKWYVTDQILHNGSTTAGNGVTFYTLLIYDFTSTGPLVFTVPPADEEGYWLISFYEAYLSEFAVVGTRATGNGGGKWLLIPPGYAGNTAGFDASHVIQAPTAQGVVLGRIAKSTPEVHTFLKGWKVTLEDGSEPESPEEPPFDIVDVEAALQVRNKDADLHFWTVAGAIWAVNKPPSLQDPLATQLRAWFGFGSDEFDPSKLTDLAKSALIHAPAIAARLIEARYFHIGKKESNYWSQFVADERWGADYLQGAAIIKGFWVANLIEDAAYIYNFLDSSGLPLVGSRTYKLSFPQAPPHDQYAFWSLQIFDLQTLTYPGPGLDAYGAGYKALKVLTSLNATTRADGSFDIFVGPEQPEELGEGQNFLPTKTSGLFHFVLRVYYPDAPVVGDSYIPPPVERVASAAGSWRSALRLAYSDSWRKWNL